MSDAPDGPQAVSGGVGMAASDDPDAARWREVLDKLDEIIRLLRRIPVPHQEA